MARRNASGEVATDGKNSRRPSLTNSLRVVPLDVLYADDGSNVPQRDYLWRSILMLLSSFASPKAGFLGFSSAMRLHFGLLPIRHRRHHRIALTLLSTSYASTVEILN